MTTHRFPQRLIRCASLFVCATLIVNILTPPGLANSLGLEVFARAELVASQALTNISTWLKTKPISPQPGNRGVKPRSPGNTTPPNQRHRSNE